MLLLLLSSLSFYGVLKFTVLHREKVSDCCSCTLGIVKINLSTLTLPLITVTFNIFSASESSLFNEDLASQHFRGRFCMFEPFETSFHGRNGYALYGHSVAYLKCICSFNYNNSLEEQAFTEIRIRSASVPRHFKLVHIRILSVGIHTVYGLSARITTF